MDDTLPSGQSIEVIYSAETIAKRIGELAQAIVGVGLERPIVVPIMHGSFVFAADLLRGLHAAGLSPDVDFLSLSSYRRGSRSVGSVSILRDLELDVAGRNVLLVEDILDTGRTLAFAKDLITARGAKRILTAVLLDKKVPRAVAVDPDFVAFDCPPVFVVGYGMDLAHRFRELPFVGHVPTKG